MTHRFPPPPRMLRRRADHSAGCLGWAAILFLMAIFFWPAGRYGLREAILHRGVADTAVIGSTSRVYGKHAYSYYAKYRCGTHSGEDEIGYSDFKRLKAGDRVPARVLYLAGLDFPLLDVPSQASQTREWLVVGSIMGGIGVFMFGGIAWNFRRERRLLETGTAVPGLVESKWISQTSSSNKYVQITYDDLAGAHWLIQKTVYSFEYEKAETGQAVTVIYNPARPGKGIAMEYSDYELRPLVG
jgi:hypothetical protein